MKIWLVVLVAGVVIVSGVWFVVKRPSEQPAGQPTDQPFEWVSDIMPGSGKGTPPPGVTTDGPWYHRVLSATSSDGLTWVKDGGIIADQASVPEAILDKDNNIRVYYVDWFNGHVISVALSHDGVNWIYKKTTIAGEVAPTLGLAAVDPDIVLLPDGRYRLFYMYAGNIYSAVSNYGINFVKENGVRFQEGGYSWMDPDVVKMGDIWRMFTWRMVGDTNYVIGAVSSDGLSFTKESDLTTVGNISCTIPVEGGYRMYYVAAGSGICSAFSSNGVSWTGEGVRLSDAGDPTVIRLSNGTYKMFYKTIIQ